MALCSPAYSQGMFGLGKFKVEQSDDRFSNDGTTTISGVNNRISRKSVPGGIHIDGKGMFVDPVVVKRRTDNSVTGVGFVIHNETDHDTTYGSPDSIGAPQRIAFLTNNDPPIVLPIRQGERKWGDTTSYNSVTRSASSEIRETGFADVTPEQFGKIAHATSLAVRIEGSDRSVTYEVKDISKAFIPNLLSFYVTYVDSSH